MDHFLRQTLPKSGAVPFGCAQNSSIHVLAECLLYSIAGDPCFYKLGSGQ